jgi:hypothetical protein
MEMTNDVCYNGANSQCTLICISSYTKLIKLDKLNNIEMCTIHYEFYKKMLVFYSLEYQVVCIAILHHCSICIIGYL